MSGKSVSPDVYESRTTAAALSPADGPPYIRNVQDYCRIARQMHIVEPVHVRLAARRGQSKIAYGTDAARFALRIGSDRKRIGKIYRFYGVCAVSDHPKPPRDSVRNLKLQKMFARKLFLCTQTQRTKVIFFFIFLKVFI